MMILGDRKSTRLNSSHLGSSYAVFCLKKRRPTETAARHGGPPTRGSPPPPAPTARRRGDPLRRSIRRHGFNLIHFFGVFFFFNDTATTEIYTLSLHDALPISARPHAHRASTGGFQLLPHRDRR